MPMESDLLTLSGELNDLSYVKRQHVSLSSQLLCATLDWMMDFSECIILEKDQMVPLQLELQNHWTCATGRGSRRRC
jgi:hypothetical protein